MEEVIDVDTATGCKQSARPMNAFLLFCKRHRAIVKEKYPTLENRNITKILGEWWSNLEVGEKASYTSLAHQYKEAFMKANPEFRWHKMPPVSVESLPSVPQKPPPVMNGEYTADPGSKLGLTSRGSSSSSSPEPAYSNNLQGKSASGPSAPKPFKKRYLAEQLCNSAPPPAAAPPPTAPYDGNLVMTPAAPPISSAGEETANACAALLELANPDHAHSHGQPAGQAVDGRRVSPSETPPFQTLREAVWSRVAGTLLKQEEDKLTEPCRDSPLNLTNQCTIRGQQIIEHIIENILDKPIEDIEPSQPVAFSLNNNLGTGPTAEDNTAASGQAVATATSDTIKASIYQSLKNDLLKKGPSSVAAEASLPPMPSKAFNGGGKAKGKKVEPVMSSAQVNAAQIQKQFQFATQVTTVASLVNRAGSPTEVMRLFGPQSLGSPVNVAGSSVTITKTRPVPISQPVSFSGDSSRSYPLMTMTPHPGLVLTPRSVVIASTGKLLITSQEQNNLVPVNLTVAKPESAAASISTSSSPVKLDIISPSEPTHCPVTTAPPRGYSPAGYPATPPTTSCHASSPLTASQPYIATSDPSTAYKRTHPEEDDDDIRRSSRSCKGKRYQAFIDEGRLNVGGRKQRRSHRSGDDDEEMDQAVVALEQEEGVATAEPVKPNHWKKKLRTISLNDNTQVQAERPPSSPAGSQPPPNFDLDAKIEAMRPLSLDEFQRKREESKKDSKGRASFSGSSRTTRQSNSVERVSKAFDASLSPGPAVSHIGRSRRRHAAPAPVN